MYYRQIITSPFSLDFKEKTVLISKKKQQKSFSSALQAVEKPRRHRTKKIKTYCYS